VRAGHGGRAIHVLRGSVAALVRWQTRHPAAQRAELEQGLTALGKLGVRPDGYRSPGWELTPQTLDLLGELGFSYDASLMADDRPYWVTSGTEPLLELPGHWSLCDWPYFGWTSYHGGLLADPAAVERISQCVDNNNGSATGGNKVQMWDCDGNTAAQNWTVNSNGTLTIDGGCMDITGANYSNGTLIEWWACNGGANQQWQAINGELVNPASGKCLDDPAFNTTNGTQLILWACNGGSNQQWQLP
jgi:hypothetical protein